MKSAIEIMKVMDGIDYGFKDKDGKNLIEDEEFWECEFGNFYRLQSPLELLENKCGVCWDQVELERELFLKKGMDVKTYFIFIKDGDMLPSHTFLTFEDNKHVYWFEHSWGEMSGIHKYSSREELLSDAIDKFTKSHSYVSEGSHLYLYEYKKPSFGITSDEFYQYIEMQTLVKELIL